MVEEDLMNKIEKGSRIKVCDDERNKIKKELEKMCCFIDIFKDVEVPSDFNDYCDKCVNFEDIDKKERDIDDLVINDYITSPKVK